MGVPCFSKFVVQIMGPTMNVDIRRHSMNRKTVILLITLIAILAPTLIFAQDELTLESLNARLEAIEAKMGDLTPGLGERVQAIEALFADPWSPDVIYKDDGICQSPLHAIESRYASILTGELHQETADAYRSSYGVSVDPTDVYLQSISFEEEGNAVYLEYLKDDRKVVEKWAHCEYLGHSEWTDDD